MSGKAALAVASPKRPQAIMPPKSTQPVEIANPIQFLYDNGILFEANRTLFHPSGLALQVQPVDPKNSKKGLRLVLLDCSADPTVVFDERTFTKGQSKWREWVRKVGWPNHKKRQEILGFTTQLPIPQHFR